MKKKDENKKNKNVDEKKVKKATDKKVENKKSVSKKVDNINTKTSSEWKKALKVIIWVAIVFAFFYLLTFIIVGDFGSDDDSEDVETSIQYDEILGGSSFTMNASKYLVVYYDTTAEDASEITNAIYNYEYSSEEPLRVYTVDLSNALNKGIITEDTSNKDPENASELAINGPTLIRFRDGDVREYIEGTDNIVDYLS